MKRFKFSFAAIIAITAVGLTISSNADAFAKRIACYKTVTTATGTHVYNGTTLPTVGQTASALSDPDDSSICSGSGRFCCATISGTTVTAVFQKTAS
ncbi:hypothetical protein [Chitinophaga sp. S165]|uniref:hypothetical protein n=1 Tax=Chitinophaga sp. S165 TaxID=2135462 RepID=UPI000D712C96|nr:hypothetical protein [Chitinophaga sp. S165]PWV44643.1 hypothetical protein C7475_11923 [Chitinophaga sp. S165]